MEFNFGRYTDSYKPKDKINYWTSASDLFEQKKYIESYKEFVKYLRDDEIGNVKTIEGGNGVDFELVQGSKKVSVNFSDKKVIAESYVARYDKLSIPFMRRLLEINYTLYYSRFAIKDDKILLKFDSNIFDCSPNKLYFALKELATKADKQDDLLVDAFSVLHNVDEGTIVNYTEEIKEIKYKYFYKWISEAIKRISELNESRFDGAISYILLSTIYKVDYLLVPEGKLTNEIERFSQLYWASENKKLLEKNIIIRDEMKKILDIPKEEIMKSFYKVKATFGIISPTAFSSVTSVINDNMGNVKWYSENNYEDIAIAILEYISGYCFFTNGMPKPVRELFHIVSVVINQEFFLEYGMMDVYYLINDDKLNDVLIKQKILEIIEKGKVQFTELKLDISKLDFSSRIFFISSLYKEMLNLNFNI
ncbi:MAG: hypothetical protein WC358_01635 [Ignavibacteria bacterium]|jgi:hypothetical protein